MTEREEKMICGKVDHTNLKKTATTKDILQLCKEAEKYGAKSVCVAPHFVEYASIILKDKGPVVCTVIGFPNGYSTTAIKVAETADALMNGADEIDMVVNINLLKEGRYEEVLREIQAIADVCKSGKFSDKEATLKVIVETCLLTKDEIKIMCGICISGGADYIKTSTGFDKKGADIEDIRMMKEFIGDRGLKIKASGGIRTLEDARDMIEAGADRIGASSLFGEIRERERVRIPDDDEYCR